MCLSRNAILFWHYTNRYAAINHTAQMQHSLPYRITAQDWLLFAGIVACWGSSFAMSKVALAHVTPEWIAAARLCIGAAVLMVAAVLQRQALPTGKRQIAILAWLGLVGNAAPFLAITWGMQFITSGVAGLLMATIPLIIIVLAHFFLPGERLTPTRTMGFLLGFAGIVVLMGPQNLLALSAHGEELIGELAVVAGCLMYGVNAISAKRSGIRGTVVNSAAILLFGAIFATATALLQSPFSLASEPASALIAIFGLGLIPTGLATLLWFRLLDRTSPTFVTMSNYLVPVFALVLGAVALDEHIGWSVLVALGLILAGIAVSQRRAAAR
jgi:drug/metabolite transporter (DMT)-like permease